MKTYAKYMGVQCGERELPTKQMGKHLIEKLEFKWFIKMKQF